MEFCVYCGNERGSRRVCCGEVHFVDEPECPECGSENVSSEHRSESGALPETHYKLCNDCQHTFNCE